MGALPAPENMHPWPSFLCLGQQFPQGSTGTKSKANLASDLCPQSPMGLGQEAMSSGICSQLVAPTGSTASLLAPLLQRMKASGPWDLLHLGPRGQRGSPEDGRVGAESRSMREDITALLPSLCGPPGGQPLRPCVLTALPPLFQAADKASRKRYEPSDKDRQSPPPAKRANLSPDRGELCSCRGLTGRGTRTPAFGKY